MADHLTIAPTLALMSQFNLTPATAVLTTTYVKQGLPVLVRHDGGAHE